MIGEIALTLLFVFANAFFVAAEFAIVKVRLSQIELRARTGGKIAGITKNMLENLNAYLSATQLGITLTSLGLGWIGESVVSLIIIKVMAGVGLQIDPTLAHKIALPASFATITVLHIVLGELAPKSLAILYPEKVSMTIALPLRLFYIVFKPLIWTLNELANLILKIFGLEAPNESEQLHSSDEIRYLIEESAESGIIDNTEHKLLENIFEFSDTPVKQIMVPRNRISAVDITWSVDEIIERYIEEGFSRMPVYSGEIDNIIGEIYGKDLLNLMRNRTLIALQDIIRPAYFVDENQKISVLLKTMQKEHAHIAIVVNEFGGAAGLVTLEDILEEIVGEIQDEYDEEAPLVEETAKNEFSVAASIAIGDANEFLPEPLPESEDYETLGGLITGKLGRIPKSGESFKAHGYSFNIIKSSERRIEEVELKLIENEKASEDDE